MESAALFTVAAFRGVRCGTVLQCLRNQEREELGLESGIEADDTKAIDVAIKALNKLIKDDNKNNSKGGKNE